MTKGPSEPAGRCDRHRLTPTLNWPPAAYCLRRRPALNPVARTAVNPCPSHDATCDEWMPLGSFRSAALAEAAASNQGICSTPDDGPSHLRCFAPIRVPHYLPLSK